MRIDRIEVYTVVLPLTEPFYSACGKETAIHTVLVRLVSEDKEGWGEGGTEYAPHWMPETATSSFFLNSEIIAPILIGQSYNTAEELLESLNSIKGNPIAKAAVESGWWMLKAAIEGKPLHALLGGNYRNVEIGETLGIEETYDKLLEKIEAAVEHGCPRVKLKVLPGWDLEMLQVVRSTFPRLKMIIDCNSIYSLDDLPLFIAIDKLNIDMIEQPLFYADLFDHAELQHKISTPICLDESITSVRDFKLALRLGSCKVLNIKYNRVGGISVAVQLHNLAQEADIPCWIGSGMESGVGMGIHTELATLPNVTYPSDISESKRFLLEDLTEPAINMNSDWTISPSSVPGTPYKPDIKKLERLTIKKVIIENHPN
jgi:O-succinylbenzoate synthase